VQVLGHHTRASTIKCFEMIRPRWRSLGYAQALMLFYALSYYNVMASYVRVRVRVRVGVRVRVRVTLVLQRHGELR
jgi:SNF family Na+-dependent transporter